MKPFHRRIAAPVFATILSTACLAPRPALPDPPASSTFYHASVANTGEISIRQGETNTLFSVHAGLFEPGWAFRAATFDKAANTVRIVAGNGNIITVIPTVTATGKTLSVHATFTADKDTPVNSIQLSAALPVNAYIGGTAVWKNNNTPQTFVIPPIVGTNRLTDGADGTLTVTEKSGINAAIFAVAGDSTLLLQDNRVFGSNELEVRIGRLSEHTLKAGQTETIQFTVTLPDSVAAGKDEPVILAASADWIPFTPASLDIVSNSALDFSRFTVDAPAGKYGRIIATPAGHFAFTNRAKPQRFYGVNLCFSANYLEHTEADRLADRLMRLGYNAVRIHHYESELVDANAPDSLTFRPDSLDKLDYLVAALKKRGIYLTTDLFVSRPVKASEMGLDEGATGDDFKDAVLVSLPAMANWKAFSKKLLTHVNPYTGIAYKDEAALAWISVINEPGMSKYRLGMAKGKLRALYASEWHTWYAKRHPETNAVPPLPTGNSDDATGRDVDAFLRFIHQRGYNAMRGFLRSEIGTKALLTYLNNSPQDLPFAAVRQSLDYVDNHFYWDHPNFIEMPWNLPSTGWSGNGSAVTAGGAGPDGIAMTRLFGKPFTVTEWDYVAPNRYRAESGLIMGAVSSLQDWDAIWHFAYSHNRESVAAPAANDYFNIAQDPLRQASERTGILLFLRGDVAIAPATMSANVPRESLVGANPLVYVFPKGTGSVLSSRVGTNLSGTAVPQIAEQGHEHSFTQKITVNPNAGQFSVATDNTVALTLESGAVWSNNTVTIRADGVRATVAVSSLDGTPVAQSKHLLITHLTDLQNTGERFASSERRVLQDWGHLPYLIRVGTAHLTLMHTGGQAAQAWRLDTSGKRVADLPVRAGKAGTELELSTQAPDGSATLYYEVVFP